LTSSVAREAAALVLLEDDFASIVHTVRLGRRVYENIRNAMRYIVSVHVPTAAMSFLPLALGWPILFFPVHIVFLEFVIDPACSIAFEAERADEHAMERPPRKPAERLFNARMLAASLALGAAVLVAVFAIYAWGVHSGRSEGETRALGFAAVVFGNLGLIVAYRARLRGMLATLVAPNVAFWWIVAGTLAALAAVIYLPAAAAIFRFSALASADLALAAAAALVALAAGSLLKSLTPP